MLQAVTHLRVMPHHAMLPLAILLLVTHPRVMLRHRP